MSAEHVHLPGCRSGQFLGAQCNCGAETAESIVDALRRELAEAIAQRDEAQAKAAAALSIAEDAQRERDEARKQRNRSKATLDQVCPPPWTGDHSRRIYEQFVGRLNRTPADEGLVRAIVDAIENEHRHVERLLGLFSCTTVNASLSDAKERMKGLAGTLKRLTNPPIYMPRET